MPVKPRPLIERFNEKYIVAENGCWTWIAYRDKRGYGYIGGGGRACGAVPAYRVSYEYYVGPVPDGLELDHLCRNPACVNWQHLEPVTHAENLRRAIGTPSWINKHKTACKRGHQFTPENTAPNTNGGRKCRTCARALSRKYKKEKRLRAKATSHAGTSCSSFRETSQESQGD